MAAPNDRKILLPADEVYVHSLLVCGPYRLMPEVPPAADLCTVYASDWYIVCWCCTDHKDLDIVMTLQDFTSVSSTPKTFVAFRRRNVSMAEAFSRQNGLIVYVLHDSFC